MTARSRSEPAQLPPVLLVDDDPHFLLSSGTVLRAAGVEPVLTVEDSRKVLPIMARRDVGVLVLDLSMPHITGEELLKKVREEFPHVPVIVLTGLNEVETAVSCMREGAFDYLVKPVEGSRFLGSVTRARKMRELQEEVTSLKQHLLSGKLESPEAFSGIATNSKKMFAIFQYAEVVARLPHPLLITGETGVGKELVARAVHAVSGRKGDFVAVNTAGLEDNVFSDTLFGHKKGAFTGADQAREGLIAQAAGGTLFLDEIGDMADTTQVKLLRLLEESKYFPLGSDTLRESSARVVCATNHNLRKRVGGGKFRKDLYYRLSAHQIHIPSLRERREDIPVLAGHFLENAAASMGKKKPTPPAEFLPLLSTYSFPGNVRELKSMIYEAVLRHPGGVLSLEHFRRVIGEQAKASDWMPVSAGGEGGPFLSGDRMPTLTEAEEFLVAEAMRRSGGNQGIAATLLGITRQALNKRLVRGSKGSKRTG